MMFKGPPSSQLVAPPPAGTYAALPGHAPPSAARLAPSVALTQSVQHLLLACVPASMLLVDVNCILEHYAHI